MKKIVSKLYLVYLSVFLMGCSINMNVASTQHDKIYDNDIALIGEDKYSEIGFSGTDKGSNLYHFSISSMSGAETIWEYEASENGEEVILDCSLSEENGGFAKLILIDPADNIIPLIEATSNRNQIEHTFIAGQGSYRIKVVGKKNAKVEGQLGYSHGTGGSF